MNILQINNTDLPGARFNGYNLQKEFNKIGITTKQLVYEKLSDDSNVISFADSIDTIGIYKDFEYQSSVQSIIFPYGNKIMQMKEFLDADIVHYHLIHNYILSLYDFAAMVSKKRSVWTIHDPWAFTGHCIYPMKCDKYLTGCVNCENLDRTLPMKKDNADNMWKLKKSIYKKLDIDIVVASKWMENIVKTSPLTKHFQRVHLIPFGINLKRYKCDIDRKKYLKRKYNIDRNTICIFFRADKSEYKGLKYIKNMLERLDINKSITLMTVGEKGLLNKFRWKYKVKEYGWINDENELASLYGVADIFLMPSTAEAFGVMAIEAMASSIPVIVMEGTALPDVVNAPECGIAFKRDDVEDFTQKVKWLIEDTEERIRRGKKGRLLAENKYDENVYFNKMLDLYYSIYIK